MSKLEVKNEKVLPHYQEVLNNFRIPTVYSKEAFYSALKYKPRSDDLFIVTYPRSGTTWVQSIVACIYRNGRPFESALDYLSNSPSLVMVGAEAAETMKRPGAIKLHLPFYLAPYSPEAKYIFVARNPKDCCLSFCHLHKITPIFKFTEGQFDDFFDLFIEGKGYFGDYFDTLISWYEHKNDSNVLFITYEELKKDIETNILKISGFMGKQYKAALESDPKFLQDVIYYSSFNYMKEFFNKQLAELSLLPPEIILNNPDVPSGFRSLFQNEKKEVYSKAGGNYEFVRKGIVGDWRNHFSKEQNERMDAKFFERTKGTDIPKLWEEEMKSSL